ncbi:hypothetical protein [Streptomyces luteolus]|uniref:Uncharacterized protein n=1 Tax=Streptomyces luteolus TaxID=3043615 RepID=A0ABT6T4W4_9ACTN|nr:hypothetical protein [Streptomyces sp. B-S-A12]MDI3422895.1 hypothetical protein [Streptomyces sp. B-S-A12]
MSLDTEHLQHTETPGLDGLRRLVDIAQAAHPAGYMPQHDVMRAQIRELSVYLRAFTETIETRARQDEELRRDAQQLLARRPGPDQPRAVQAEHLRQLARLNQRYLGIAQTRRPDQSATAAD